MQEAIERTTTCNLWAIAKDITSVVGSIFGLLSVARGFSLLPGIVSATLSLAATVFAVIRKLYEETMTFKPINFFDNKHVTLVTV